MGDRRPSLGWRIDTGRPGYSQGAYRVLVASDRKLLEANRGDIWDSGVVRERAEPACEIRGRSAAALLRLLLEGEGVGHGRRRIGLESGGIVADRAVRASFRLEGGVGVLPFRRGVAAPQVQVEPADRAGELVHGGQCRRIYAPAGGAALAGPQGDGVHLRTGLLRTLYQRPQGRRPGPESCCSPITTSGWCMRPTTLRTGWRRGAMPWASCWATAGTARRRGMSSACTT